MAFFDDFGKKLSQASQNTIQKTKEMADIAKINSLISAEEKKMESIYLEIGKIYADNHAEDCEEIFKDSIQMIDVCKQNVENYANQIRMIKGVKNCPKCGAEVQNSSIFCGICGSELPKSLEPVEVNPMQEVKRFCANCGVELEVGAMFCGECGTKAEESEVV